MTYNNDLKWMKNYNLLKEYILQRGHLPNKHVEENRNLLSWAKYNRKKIKSGTLEEWKTKLFLNLLDMRSHEHTGGRKNRLPTNDPKTEV